MFEDPNLIIGLGGIAVGIVGAAAAATPTITGYLERKRKDDNDEADRKREDAIRRMILMNDLTRDAIAGQETTDYGQDLVKAAAGN